MTDKDAAPLCPSSRGRAGHILLGIVDAGGRVLFMPRAEAVDEAFVEIARSGRPPEQRFRFSSPCLKGGCEKWNGTSCGVARVLHEQAPALLDVPADATPQACAIRERCRWHLEHGDSVCFACEWVVTQRGANENNESLRAHPGLTGESDG